MIYKKADEDINDEIFESWVGVLKDKEKKRVHWMDRCTRCEC